ncbi:Hypothetical predicted protein [Octopus vulgaris]|uniref:Uncharacterized protein n=1 Tax=Octopus vulgaris TaxID=6645 RepID=A0AA36BSR8_OCTVU|nr:Hypothetical predicted protein [Octopus vulgaris]
MHRGELAEYSEDLAVLGGMGHWQIQLRIESLVDDIMQHFVIESEKHIQRHTGTKRVNAKLKERSCVKPVVILTMEVQMALTLQYN